MSAKSKATYRCNKCGKVTTRTRDELKWDRNGAFPGFPRWIKTYCDSSHKEARWYQIK